MAKGVLPWATVCRVPLSHQVWRPGRSESKPGRWQCNRFTTGALGCI